MFHSLAQTTQTYITWDPLLSAKLEQNWRGVAIVKPQHSPGGNKSMPQENRCTEQLYLRPAALHFHSSDYLRIERKLNLVAHWRADFKLNHGELKPKKKKKLLWCFCVNINISWPWKVTQQEMWESDAHCEGTMLIMRVLSTLLTLSCYSFHIFTRICRFGAEPVSRISRILPVVKRHLTFLFLQSAQKWNSQLENNNKRKDIPTNHNSHFNDLIMILT